MGGGAQGVMRRRQSGDGQREGGSGGGGEGMFGGQRRGAVAEKPRREKNKQLAMVNITTLFHTFSKSGQTLKSKSPTRNCTSLIRAGVKKTKTPDFCSRHKVQKRFEQRVN